MSKEQKKKVSKKSTKKKVRKGTNKKKAAKNNLYGLLIEEIRTIQDTKKAELIRPMVPIYDWIDSPYYVGDLVYTLYPKYKQHIKSIFDPERDESDYIDEIIMRCSIGTG